MLPKTFKAMETWDGKELPEEEVFEAFYLDFRKLVDENERVNYQRNLIIRKMVLKVLLKN